MSKRTELLSDLARQALAQYDADVKAGGEPIYPQWAKELQDVLKASEQLGAALRDLEVSANSLQYCFDRRPENFGVALTQLKADAKRARVALAAVEAA